MRQIVLDTETTGLDAALGHRIIEVGCIEIINRRLTGRRFQQYVNPQREIDAGAAEVHGLTLADLREKPDFSEIAVEFIEFVRGAELVIHNAQFDVGFLDAEFTRMGPAWGRIADYCTVFDTLQLAREMHPGQRNSLDALCRRYEVNNAHRELHGALLDAELLAEVYLAMTGGQAVFALDASRDAGLRSPGQRAALRTLPDQLRVVEASALERVEHERALARLDKASGGACLWLK